MDILFGFFLPEWTIQGIYIYIIGGLIRMLFIFVIGFEFKDWREKQNKTVQAITYPVVTLWFIYGFLYDIFLNYLITIPTKDLPAKWDETITNRMKRYKLNEPTSWKGRFSFWACKQLNRHDKDHC